MPPGSIQADSTMLSREAFSNMLKKQAHQGSVYPGEDQANELPAGWANSAIGINVLSYDLGRDLRTQGKRPPAAPAIGDPPVARLILEQQSDRSPGREAVLYFFKLLRKFFLKAFCASGSAFGCFERGASFRHSFRCRSLYTYAIETFFPTLLQISACR